MRRMVIVTDGWPCQYEECRPGLFVYQDMVGMKSEYGDDGYCDTGEYFARKDAVVSPVVAVWEEFE